MPAARASTNVIDAAEQTRSEDAQLAERVKTGDTEALGLLYDRNSSLALAVAQRMVGDRSTAEDLVHDAFVAVWQKIGRFDSSRGTVRSWVLTIVRNRAIDRMRSSRVRLETDDPDEMPSLSTGHDPTADEAGGNISAAQLRLAIEQLPREQREAVELAYFGGRTYREIATITGVPQGTANGRLRLALGKLREALAMTDAAPASFQFAQAAQAAEADRGDR